MTQLSPLEKAQAKRAEMKAAGVEVQRLSPTEKAARNPKSLRMAINAKCWECSCEQRSEIRDCSITACPLWPVRPYQSADDGEQETEPG